MPAYKEDNGTWTSKFKYKNWLGDWKQKTKRGFSKKGDANKFEIDFKAKFVHSSDIAFSALVENYLADFVDNKKIDVTTAERKRGTFEGKIIPFFKDKSINQIDELDVLNWQSWIKKQGYDKYPDKDGYAPTYLKSMNNELSAVMNYACRYYKLPSNPCTNAGSMGKSEADVMQIWTLDEFKLFIGYADKSAAKVAFDILFWTGIREGELLALTLADFLPNLKLNIDKSFAVVKGVQIIKDPKNEPSVRCIAIPEFLYNEVQDYASGLYGLQQTDRLFMFTKSFLLKEIKRVANMADLNIIRVHDLRHSHVSLLIEMGFNILMISERLGHKTVQTTWNTYAHLYPDKGKQIAYGLQEVNLNGITTNHSAEDQMLSLLGEIKKNLPNYNTYERDDIIMWNSKRKVKEIVDRLSFDNTVISYEDESNVIVEPTEAFIVMMKEGYFELSKEIIFCFSSKGLPVQYL
ncbi:MAG: tyrosine-type recombinase/integrase [Velocimicrobium sp.]